MVSVGVVFAYGALAALTVVLGAWTVSAHRALDEPVHWGRFETTSHDCESGRYGETCTPVGTWTAEDGSSSFDGIELDGGGWDPDGMPTGPVRAGYRAFDTDEGVPDTVYDTEEVDQIWLGPGLAALVTAGSLVALAVRSGDAAIVVRWGQRAAARRR